jgi:hypothetical protein
MLSVVSKQPDGISLAVQSTQLSKEVLLWGVVSVIAGVGVVKGVAGAHLQVL